MTVSSAIKSLVKYGVREGLLDALDEMWAVNRVLEVLELDAIDSDAEIIADASLERPCLIMLVKTEFVRILLFTEICLIQKLWVPYARDPLRLSRNSTSFITRLPKRQLNSIITFQEKVTI